MKKKLLISVLLLTFAWVSAQNTSKSPVQLNALQFEKTANYTAKKDLILLWDNTNINTLDGVVGGTSTYWSGNNNWAWIADDFDADGPWIIYKISSKGYYPEEPAIIPTKMTVVIYENNGGKPGAELYRNTGIPVENVLEPEIILPEPFALPAAGKYWITIAATFDRTVNNNAGVKYYRWYISRGTKQIGANYHYYDKLGVYAPTYSTATWVDASPITSLYSSYFKIEGDPGVEFDCQHVTNLTAEYDVLDCSKAEITWRAPAGKGDFSYIVYRDGEEMATVTTESYVDATLEPTLKHTWGVKVVCTGYTPVITVTKEACKEPDCPQMPKKFAVNVNQAECTATLTWQAPSEILWDNSKPTFDGGLLSYRFMKDYYNHTSVLADDFDVPSGETWYVTEVHCGGSYAPAGQPPFEIPDFIGIEIYDDLNNMPGTLLYYFPYLSLVGGMTSNSYVILPYPVKLLNGLKYWVSIAGIYDRTYSDNCGYAIYALAEERGLPVFQWKEKETGDEGWRPIEVMDWTGVSLNFRIQGKKYAEPVRYKEIC
ncbi:MAG: hypothetical protein FWC10_06610 [Lentimicrobiaceae bacterium]|nr:hypothetical protein [Lentimicrobiaceae bacterium]